MSRSAFSLATSRLSRAISACSGFICPWPGKACDGSSANALTQLRSWVGCTPQVLRGLRITNPALLDQPNSLKLELTGKLPSLHDAPPAPSKHLTRCLRNRVQANEPGFLAWLTQVRKDLDLRADGE